MTTAERVARLRLPRQATKSRRVYDMIAEYPGVRVIAQEIADECGLPLRYASACAHNLARQGRIKCQTGGRGRQAEFWVNA